MWADGRVVFGYEGRAPSEMQQTRVAPDVVEALRTRVFAALDGESLYDELGLADPATGKQVGVLGHGFLARIFVRAGDAWRIAFVHGVSREDALAPPAPTSPIPALGGVVHEQPSPRFVAAYRLLLDARPTRGEPWRPSAYDVWLYTGQPVVARVPWPADLPVPSHEPNACRVLDTGDGGCPYRIGPADVVAAERLRARLQQLEPPRGVEWAGESWAISLTERYAGQDAIDRGGRCAASMIRVGRFGQQW
ncbi:MAG TPA: hypothetical protein VM734_32190 [Kofleriaceae bacterium]|nr:hypothetical protein [Kofleriaceae bacterium]